MNFYVLKSKEHMSLLNYRVSCEDIYNNYRVLGIVILIRYFFRNRFDNIRDLGDLTCSLSL